MIVYITPDIRIEPYANNVFPLFKYRKVCELLVKDGTLSPGNLRLASPVPMELACLAHSAAYCRDLETGALSTMAQRGIGFPWTVNLILRARYATGATLLAAQTALSHSISGGLAGGTHHAHIDFGFGFCVLNDLAVTAKTLLARGQVKRVAVVDLDFHPGDGTADICRNDPSIYTLSIHGRSILGRGPIGSTFDEDLSWGIKDGEYLEVIARTLRGVKDFHPDIILYQGGVDGLSGDRLGKFSLSIEGMKKRDECIFRFCQEHAIPVAFTMGGGYNKDPYLLAQAHANTVRAAREVFERGKWGG